MSNTQRIGAYRIERFTNVFLKGCILSALIGVVIGSVAVGIIGRHLYNTMVLDYEGQLSAVRKEMKTEAEAHRNAMNESDRMHAARLSVVTDNVADLEATIADKGAQIASLEQSLLEIEAEQAEDFNLIKRYYYVLRDAPDNSGLSIDTIRYLDEQCKAWNVNPHWMWAIYDVESTFRTKCDNPKSSARGLGQTLASSARDYWENILGHGKGSYSHEMAYDPYVNMEITVAMIGRNLQANGSMESSIWLYGDRTSTYFGKVLAAGQRHGVTLSENNAYYPYY